MGEPCPLELHARVRQHRVIEIEAERAGRAGSEELEDAARSGAEIDEQPKGFPPERRIHGGFDVLLGHVKRADLIPFARMRLEIGLRGLGACLLDGGSPRAVARESEVGRIEARDDCTCERRLSAGVGETE